MLKIVGSVQKTVMFPTNTEVYDMCTNVQNHQVYKRKWNTWRAHSINHTILSSSCAHLSFYSQGFAAPNWSSKPVPWLRFPILLRFPRPGWSMLTAFPFKSTDRGAYMIGSGTSETRRRLCSQLKLQQTSRAAPTARRKSKSATNASSRPIPRIIPAKQTATLSRLVFSKPTRFCNAVAHIDDSPRKIPLQNTHEFDYLDKHPRIPLIFRDISKKFLHANRQYFATFHNKWNGTCWKTVIFMTV